VANRYTPAWLPIAWPLTAGASWESRFTEEWPRDRRTEDIVRKCEAGAEETITVPAGTFSASHVTCVRRRTGATAFEVWYSPEVGNNVKEQGAVSSGMLVRELTGFKLAARADAPRDR
jgi:outer membrane protein assembly factor BamB